MKSLFTAFLIALAFSAYSQGKDAGLTILEKLFSQNLLPQKKITQEKEGFTRELIPFEVRPNATMKKYLLNEYDKVNTVIGSVYIISKNDIDGNTDLFKVQLGDYPVVLAGSSPKNIKAKVKMVVKINDEDVNLSEPFSKMINKCEEGTEFCIDHWVVWYLEETGEIVDIILEGSDCYTCGGTGGGGGGNTTPPNQVTCSSDEGAAVSIHESVSYSGVGDTRYSSHQWTFFQRTGLRIKSFEKGTQELTYIGNNNHEWRFTSLDHISTSQTGEDNEFDITHTIISPVGTPDGYGQYARMELNYKIDYKCKSNPNVSFQKELNSNSTWCANCPSGPWIFGPTLIQ